MDKNEEIEKLKNQIDSLNSELNELKKEKSSSSFYADILSITSDFMSVIDNSYTYLAVNNAYLNAHKITQNQIIGKTVSNFWGNELFEATIKPSLEKAFEGSKTKYTEWFNFKGIGKKFIEVTYFPYNDAEKGLKGVVVRGRDITQQKQAEQALRESEQKFEALDDNKLLGFAVICKTPAKFLYVNKTLAKLAGYRVKELKEFSFSQIVNLIYKKDRKLFINICPALLSGEIESYSQIFRSVNKNSQIIWIEAFANKIEFNGEPALLIAFKDISERTIAEEKVAKYVKKLKRSKKREEQKSAELTNLYQQISQRKAQLKKENADKDKFFSIISHDLRSPFTALLGYTQLLAEDFDSFGKEELKTAIEAISNISHNIFQLIEGLLEWSRTTTGRIEYNPELFELSNAAKTVKIITNGLAHKKNISLKIKVTEKQMVFADLKMVATILRNLVNNAIKFTHPNGQITIEATTNKNETTVSVSDNGLGMSQETVEKLFKINIHHTTPGTNNEIGTGLGLIISKEFVEMNHGSIWVESKIGKGSKFLFTLPTSKLTNT